MTEKAEPSKSGRQSWHWLPPLPIVEQPYFVWPLQPILLVKHILGKGYLLASPGLCIVLAIIFWKMLGPVERWATVDFDWVALLYALNLGVIIAVGGTLHLYFYRFAVQGTERKYYSQPLAKNNARFFLRDQLKENIFWSCLSGATVSTVFLVLFMWLYGQDLLPTISLKENTIWFVLAFPVLHIWGSLHFYFIHRFLHYEPLYTRVHALHHRNIITGPWSGLSMHPIEHLLFFSVVVIHLFVGLHPIHLLYLMLHTSVGALKDHTGYESLLLRGQSVVSLSHLYHQLHHRHFNCNYGTSVMPWDKWFGSFHDGTPEGAARLRAKKLNIVKRE